MSPAQMPKAILALIVVIAVWASACTPRARGAATLEVVRVAAAADLRGAMPEVLRAFGALHPKVRIEPTFGSSGTFFAQIEAGADFDVFMSADLDYPQKLVEHGRALADSLTRYGTGRLAIWVPRASTLTIERDGLLALNHPSVHRVALANPRHAPYGKAAEAALHAVGLWEPLRERLVLGENVAQAAQYAQSGAVDASLIAYALALTSPLHEEGRYVLIPQTLHRPLEQAAVVVVDPASPRSKEGARRFVEYLGSEAGGELLGRHGFTRAGK